jgi:hypothetical protein
LLGVKPLARRVYESFSSASALRSSAYYDAEWVTNWVIDTISDTDD